jgi:3-dehydroquinate dehydratase-2
VNWTTFLTACTLRRFRVSGRKLDGIVAKILVLHGPNLNLLGAREPQIYGRETLADINQQLAAHALSAGHELLWFQSNAEHELIGRIHQARDDQTALILCNAGAFTHTSIALRDAFAAVAIPFIEVHLSNVYAREPFRHHSYLSDLAIGVICGFGSDSSGLALKAAIRQLQIPASGAT